MNILRMIHDYLFRTALVVVTMMSFLQAQAAAPDYPRRVPNLPDNSFNYAVVRVEIYPSPCLLGRIDEIVTNEKALTLIAEVEYSKYYFTPLVLQNLLAQEIARELPNYRFVCLETEWFVEGRQFRAREYLPEVITGGLHIFARVFGDPQGERRQRIIDLKSTYQHVFKQLSHPWLSFTKQIIRSMPRKLRKPRIRVDRSYGRSNGQETSLAEYKLKSELLRADQACDLDEAQGIIRLGKEWNDLRQLKEEREERKTKAKTVIPDPADTPSEDPLPVWWDTGTVASLMAPPNALR
jgi:hypothetical protein